MNGTAALSASGQYGKTRVCEAIIGWADLMLGAKVREVLQAEIAAGGGRFRGVALRHVLRRGHRRQVRVARDAAAPPARPEVPRGLRRARQARPDLRFLALPSAAARPGRSGARLPGHDDHRRSRRRRSGRRATMPGKHGRDHAGSGRRASPTLAAVPERQHEAGRARHDLVRLRLPRARRRRPPRRSWRTPGGPISRPASRRSAPTRCMFESNFPPDKQSCGYTELWNALSGSPQALRRRKDRSLQWHGGAGLSDDQALGRTITRDLRRRLLPPAAFHRQRSIALLTGAQPVYGDTQHSGAFTCSRLAR